jgi:O-antigen/teichoic acid export membrane protein
MSVFGDFLSLASGRVLLIPLGFISSALATRILGPERFGKIALFGMIAGIVGLLTSNWTLGAVLRFGREEYDKTAKVNRTFWARNIILIPLLSLGCLATYLLRDPLMRYIDLPQWLIWLIVASVLASALSGYLDYLLQSVHRLKAYAWLPALRSLVGIFVLVAILFGFIETSCAAVITAGVCGILVITFLAWPVLLPFRTLMPVRTDMKTFRDVFSFSYPIILGNLAAYTVNWVDVLVIKHYVTTSDVGTYQLAYSMLNHLVGWLSTITVLMGPMLISFVAARREDLVLHYSQRLTPQLVLILATGIGVMMGVAPIAFRMVYGHEFTVSGVYFQVLLAGLTFSLITFAYSGVITAFKLIKLAVIAGVARGLVNLVGDLLLVPTAGPLGAAVATAASTGIAAMLYLAICQKHMRTRLLWQLSLIAPAMLALAVCMVTTETWALVLGPMVSLCVSYLLARAFRLFKPEDAEFLRHVSMPPGIRNVCILVYSVLAKAT